MIMTALFRQSHRSERRDYCNNNPECKLRCSVQAQFAMLRSFVGSLKGMVAGRNNRLLQYRSSESTFIVISVTYLRRLNLLSKYMSVSEGLDYMDLSSSLSIVLWHIDLALVLPTVAGTRATEPL